MSPVKQPTDAHRAAVADALLRIEIQLARKRKLAVVIGKRPLKLQPELFDRPSA